jgi:hypothetical protein
MKALSRKFLFGIEIAVATALALGAAASCGSRTGLPGEGRTPIPAVDAADAGDAGDVGADLFTPPDTTEELPPPDVFLPDVPVINPCPDAAATLIYVFTASSLLYSFDPTTFLFTPIGTISCPSTSSPNSMAVDRRGVAYVSFNDGELFRVSTRTAACSSTGFNAKAEGNIPYGMGFVAGAVDGGTDAGFDGGDAGDSVDTLFVSLQRKMVGDILSTIDTKTFELTEVGPYEPSVFEAELTGTGLGQLFAFEANPLEASTGGGSFIDQIDPTSAKVLMQYALPSVDRGNDWAFAYWGGVFFTFTAQGGPTIVHRFDPVTMGVTKVATFPSDDQVVGAGVSTCAPP